MDYQKLLHQLVLDNYNKNQWVASQGSDFYVEWLKDEIDEVVVELTNGNQDLIEFELVDILWTLENLLERLHQEWKIDKTWLYKKAYTKYAQRLPNIASWWDPVSKEEQDNMWNEAKMRQKKELGII